MMRSMYSGVSGLRVHQTKMDVIGNNIANVNTVGYKSTSAQFAESFSQVLRGAGSPQGGLGGTNPQQIGLGVQVAALDVNHNKGSAQRTDKPLDLMIDGNGFFCITNDPNYENVYFTRAGNFTTDVFGNVVTPSGFKVLGINGEPIKVDKSETVVGTATSEVEIVGNINMLTKLKEDAPVFDDTPAYTTSMKVFDSLGTAHTVSMNFGQRIEYAMPAGNPTQRGFLRQLNFENEFITDGATPPVKVGKKGSIQKYDLTTAGAIPQAPPSGTAPETFYAMFDEEGKFQKIVTGANIGNDGIADSVVDIPAGQSLTLNMQPAGADPIAITLFSPANGTTPKVSAFEKFTHYAAESSALGKKLNGNASGFLDNFNVSATGEVVGIFTNGERKTMGQIMLATFDNNVGLQKLGNNMFVNTVNSGAPRYGKAGSGSFGKLAPGAIEMSNVDLSGEFTDMITTQRGFQANSRVVTTSDEMLQELVNLKR